MIILSAVIWYIYSKTTLGYKIKMVGLNKTNAKYVGVNEKLMTVFVMAYRVHWLLLEVSFTLF
ncbi:ABC transporter permease subunit [Mycoplasmopsis felis]|uniref:ABC transporter permease subunit n=1 Tax=Mycoplasmopsis felis TaxID=33923 RepID=UPI003A5C8562